MSPTAEPFLLVLRWGFPSLEMSWQLQHHKALPCYEHLLWGRREKPLLSLSQTDFLSSLSLDICFQVSERENCGCNETVQQAQSQGAAHMVLHSPGQTHSPLFDKTSTSRVPTCFPTAHHLVLLECTFFPRYWTKHPCSVGSGESIAVDLLYNLVCKCRGQPLGISNNREARLLEGRHPE